MIPTRDYLHDSRLVRGRIVIAGGVMALLAAILVGTLAYIQVIQHQRYSTLAQNNRINLAPLAPLRGLIYDRNGEILAENQRVYNLEILPDQVDDMDRLLEQLSQLVELTEEDVRRFKELLKRRQSFERQILRTSLSEQEAARVALHQHRYPGAELQARLQRSYPEGMLTAHVVGYVGRINVDDLKKIDRQAYRELGYIGRTGIEAHYESLLRGTPGFERVETNAHGKEVRILERISPVTGQTLNLSLDIQLQRKSIEALQGFEGAIVAIAPDSGEVLAFAGAPGFDPNPFVAGISKQAYERLRTPVERPLLNRALSGRYAPGSTIKGFMLLTGLENGINRDKHEFCPGWYSLPNHSHRYRDWKRTGHGSMDGRDSIIHSCDVYFYTLAQKLGIDSIHHGMSRFGFGKQTGVDLPGEPGGLLPSREWKRRTRNEAWFPGETVITGIGQGYMLVTPLQLAAATATLANRGKRVTPRLLLSVENPRSGARETHDPIVAGQESMKSTDSYEYVINSMRDVVHGPTGTARSISHDIRYVMAGKTGTAQVTELPQNDHEVEPRTEKKFQDHSLFVAFAPIDDPKIAIAVVIEHAGSGSGTAAPIARKLLDYYLIKRLGMFKETAKSVAEG